MMKKRLTAILFILGLVLLASCGKTEEAVPELLEPVRGKLDTGVVTRQDFMVTDVYTGAMTPKVTQVYMEGSGTVENFTVWNGKKVKKGDVLLELEGELVADRIESTEEALEKLEKEAAYSAELSDIDIQVKSRELTHYTNLGMQGNVLALKQLEVEEAKLRKQQSEEQYEMQKAELQRTLEELKTDAENLKLTAPCSGYVYIDESLTNGSYLMTGRAVMKILDEDDLVFRTDGMVSEALMNEEYYGWINGERYELEYIPIEREVMVARIAAGESLYSEFKVIGDSALKNGMTGAVILNTKKTENVLTVPMNAIAHDSGGSYLYIETEDGNEKRYVSVGKSNGVVTEIRSGAEEGEVFHVQK